MTPETLLASLPEDLHTALRVAITDSEHRFLGTADLRSVAKHVYLDAPLDRAALERAVAGVVDYVAAQQTLAEMAAKSFALLSASEPVTDGEVPYWFVKPWLRALTSPWDERLAEAIIEAQDYLLDKVASE